MEDVVSFVQEAEQQLALLKADEGLTVAQLEGWPKQRLDVLREAAGQFQELTYLQVKYQKWMLQQVGGHFCFCACLYCLFSSFANRLHFVQATSSSYTHVVSLPDGVHAS